MKKVVAGLFATLVAAVVVSFFAVPAFAALDGRKAQAVVEGDLVKAIRVYDFSGYDYFSVRQMAEVYGGNLAWHPVTGKVALTIRNRRLDIFIKSTRVLVEGKKKRLSVPTRSSSADVFVPVTFILSKDFSNFTDTMSTWNPDTAVLTVDHKVTVAAPRFYSKPESTQIVIELYDTLSHRWTEKKGQAALSFPKGQAVKETLAVNDGAVKTIDVRTEKGAAVVLVTLGEAAGAVEKKVLTNPSRIVVEVKHAVPKKEAPIIPLPVALSSASAAGTASASAISAESVPASVVVTPAVAPVRITPEVQKNTPAKRKLIVLDAGHGGDDPGAVGRSGTKEKDINLAIVKELKRLLVEDGEYDVFLTRSNDTFIPLVDRTTMANDRKADLFISVHSNASPRRDTAGFEIYFLSEKATDADAAATALLENSAINFENKPSKRQTQLQELLWSMVVNEFINDSSELCSFITGQVTHRIRIENRGVRQAGFYVLRGAQMPAVLVECAFLSNSGEEAKLGSKRFQRQMADAIYQGIRDYEVRKNGKRTLNAKQYNKGNGTQAAHHKNLE